MGKQFCIFFNEDKASSFFIYGIKILIKWFYNLYLTVLQFNNLS